jgi:3D (Asp-Asp-Asp) domain-containing protein
VLVKMAVKVFRGVFPNQGAVLAAVLLIVVISVLTCIGVVYAKAGGRITLLSATATKVDNSGAPEQSGQWQTVPMRVTAYCPCEKCCGKYSNGQTACGHKIRPGDAFVAADKEYSFGTEIIIPGYENAAPVKVLDRGGAIRGNRLDVFFGSHEEALKWGVKDLNVKVRRK